MKIENNIQAYRTKLREIILDFLLMQGKFDFISATTLIDYVIENAYYKPGNYDQTLESGKNWYQSKRVSIQQCLARMAVINTRRDPSRPLIEKKKQRGLTYWKITYAGYELLQRDLSLLPNSGIDVKLLADPRTVGE